ncbi:ZSCA2 protein, partial [Sapayoa aenigma]|nr:ZSCA2 protein [Sapayoa aenigma]
CREGSQSISQSSSLVVHEQLHTRVKPSECLECGRSFSWSSSLRQHQRSHTRELP